MKAAKVGKVGKADQSKKPNQAEQYYLQGRAFHDAGDLRQAEQAYRQVLTLIPKQPDALHMLGVAAFQRNDFESAVKLMKDAIQQAPKSGLLRYNLGNALREMGRLHEAAEAFAAACERDPADLAALKNLGNIYKETNQWEKALACYDQLLAKDPNHAMAKNNKAIGLLTQKRFAEGFALYESRLEFDADDSPIVTDFMTRQAEDWDGRMPPKPLLVLPEQGLGDQVFYGGMLGDLENTGIEAFVCLDERLIPLFKRSFPGLDFATRSQIEGLNPSDHLFGAQIMMGSMGKFLRRDEADFQHVRSPYLKCDKARSAALRERIKDPNRLVVGISWNSVNANHGKTKSCTLDDLSAMLSLPNVDFVDLQYGETFFERMMASQATGANITRLHDIDNLMDIDGLAALIDACDIVVTVSNTTAHIAAALGKPTLVLLPWHTPLWYWHQDSMDSPWYPTAVLLRQEALGDWSSPVQRAAMIVEGLAA